MIILLLVVCILLTVFGRNNEIIQALSAISCIICIVSLILLIVSISEASILDDKIAMYQEENTKIESQIDELVKGYMDYESDTLKEFKAESSITLVSLYPELKSDTLVQTQITTYTENNNKIKALKEELLMKSVYRWWLYFGR